MDRNVKLTIGLGIFAIFAILIGLYAYSQSREYLKGPQIVINEPQNGATLLEAPIVIAGNAQNVSRITLNGASIFVDSKGDFREKLLLLPGYNILTISAEDRFGRKAEKTLELVYRPESAESVIPPFLKEVPESVRVEDL